MLRIFSYVILTVLGLALIFACSAVQHAEPPQPGEYYYSSFLKNNYTWLARIVFLIAGVIIGYFSRLNPWLAGLSLILIMPIAAFYEASVYHGSHNLIPFELVLYFLFSLPAVAGVYLGRLLTKLNRRAA